MADFFTNHSKFPSSANSVQKLVSKMFNVAWIREEIEGGDPNHWIVIVWLQ